MLTHDTEAEVEVELLYDRAVTLPGWALERLALRLVAALEHVEGPPPQPGEHRGESLDETIRRRLEEIDRGEVEMVPWATVRDRLLSKYGHEA